MESAPSPKTPSAAAVHLGLVGVQLAFATHYITSKLVVRDLPPGALAVVRPFAGALVLLAIQSLRGGALPRIARRDLPRIALCALLGMAANQVLFFEGLARTEAVNASVLATTIPVFTLIAGLVLGRERASLQTTIGILLSLGGVLYLIGVEAFSVGAQTWIGDLFIVLNCVCYGVYLVLVGDLATKYGSLPFVIVLFTFGGLWVLPYGIGDLIAHAPTTAASTWWLVVYTVFVPTVFTYVVNAWALRHAKASMVAVYIYLQPVGAALLAVVWLGEELTTRDLVAALLVFAGIALVTRRRRPATTARPSDR